MVHGTLFVGSKCIVLLDQDLYSRSNLKTFSSNVGVPPDPQLANGRCRTKHKIFCLRKYPNSLCHSREWKRWWYREGRGSGYCIYIPGGYRKSDGFNAMMISCLLYVPINIHYSKNWTVMTHIYVAYSYFSTSTRVHVSMWRVSEFDSKCHSGLQTDLGVGETAPVLHLTRMSHWCELYCWRSCGVDVGSRWSSSRNEMDGI